MELGFIGLGRMGKNMVLRLLRDKHRVVAWAPHEKSVKEVAAEGAVGGKSLADVVGRLADRPRAVWAMVPSGDATEQTIRDLAGHLEPGDVVIDGGNSNYKESVRRAKFLAERKIDFVDSGTSGGIWGLANGYCLMVGGDEGVCRRLEPIFTTL